MKRPIRQSTEHDSQVALFRWAAFRSATVPELRLMFAIPNGGARNRIVGAKMKAEGVKRGVPDIFLPVPRGCYHGLWLEMKTGQGKLSDHQCQWRDDLLSMSYSWVLCRSTEEAIGAIWRYLGRSA